MHNFLPIFLILTIRTLSSWFCLLTTNGPHIFTREKKILAPALVANVRHLFQTEKI
jgi:hypothetical protein